MIIPLSKMPIKHIREEFTDGFVIDFLITAWSYTHRRSQEVTTITRIYAIVAKEGIESKYSWGSRFLLLGEALNSNWGSLFHLEDFKWMPVLGIGDSRYKSYDIVKCETWKESYKAAEDLIVATVAEYKALLQDRDEQINVTFAGWDEEPATIRKREVII